MADDDALAGKSIAEADTAAIEARLRQLHERSGEEGEAAEEDGQLSATVSLIDKRLAELRASFARDELSLSAIQPPSTAGPGDEAESLEGMPFDSSRYNGTLTASDRIVEDDEDATDPVENGTTAHHPHAGIGREADQTSELGATSDSALNMLENSLDFTSENANAGAAAPEPPPPPILNGPHAVLVTHGKVRCIVVADCWSNRLTLLTREGMELGVAGVGSEGHVDSRMQDAELNGPHGLCKDRAGNMFVADAYNQCVRRLTPLVLNEAAETVEELVQAEMFTLAGCGEKGFSDGPAREARFCYPHDVEVHYPPDSPPVMLVADFDNNCLRRVLMHEGAGEHVTSWAGSNIGTPGFKDGHVKDALFNHPGGLAVRFPAPAASTRDVVAGVGVGVGAGAGDTTEIFVADTYNHAVRRITCVRGSWQVATIAGGGGKGFRDGLGSMARFNCPTGLAIGAHGDIYVADFSNHAVRLVRREASGVWRVSTVVGQAVSCGDGEPEVGVSGFVDGPSGEARLNRPHGLTYDSDFSVLYVADCMNNRLRCVQGSVVSTLV